MEKILLGKIISSVVADNRYQNAWSSCQMCKIHQSGQNLAESTCVCLEQRQDSRQGPLGLSSEVARLRNHDGPWTISLFTFLPFRFLLFSSRPPLYSEHRASVQLMSNTLFRNRWSLKLGMRLRPTKLSPTTTTSSLCTGDYWEPTQTLVQCTGSLEQDPWSFCSTEWLAVPQLGICLQRELDIGEKSLRMLAGPQHGAPAFRLAEQGYDVWLGNFRGNHESRCHSIRGQIWLFHLPGSTRP